jgi:hypothetical protein
MLPQHIIQSVKTYVIVSRNRVIVYWLLINTYMYICGRGRVPGISTNVCVGDGGIGARGWAGCQQKAYSDKREFKWHMRVYLYPHHYSIA